MYNNIYQNPDNIFTTVNYDLPVSKSTVGSPVNRAVFEIDKILKQQQTQIDYNNADNNNLWNDNKRQDALIAANDNNIAQNLTEIQRLAQKVADIEAGGGEIAPDVMAKLRELSEKINEYDDRFSNIDFEISATNGNVSNIQRSVNNLTSESNLAKTEIDAIKQINEEQNTELSAIKTENETNKTNIANLTESLHGTDSNVENLDMKIVTIDTKLNTITRIEHTDEEGVKFFFFERNGVVNFRIYIPFATDYTGTVFVINTAQHNVRKNINPIITSFGAIATTIDGSIAKPCLLRFIFNNEMLHINLNLLEAINKPFDVYGVYFNENYEKIENIIID